MHILEKDCIFAKKLNGIKEFHPHPEGWGFHSLSYIKPLGVEYIKQYYIKELTHFCDIYFPKKNIIVEFNGDFWHCNPSKYPNGPIHHIQETKIMKDANLRTYCDMHDILLIEIWESEYKENCEKIKQILKEAIL